MNGWIGKDRHGCMVNGWMNGWIEGWMGMDRQGWEWMGMDAWWMEDGLKDGWMGMNRQEWAWMHGGWMDEWMD